MYYSSGNLSLTLLLSSLLLVLVTGGSVSYEDCGSTANVTALRVTGCVTPPCVFVKGRSYELEIDATSNCRSVKLPYKVTAKVIFPFTILKGNACDVLSKGNCPVSVGEEFTYKNIINVSRSYPSFHAKVKALVQNDDSESVICLILDVVIKRKSSKFQFML